MLKYQYFITAHELFPQPNISFEEGAASKGMLCSNDDQYCRKLFVFADDTDIQSYRVDHDGSSCVAVSTGMFYTVFSGTIRRVISSTNRYKFRPI